MPLHRDEPGRNGVHGDAVRSELSSPAPRQPYLGALRRHVGGAARRRSVDDLRVDLDDAPPPPLTHPRNNGAAEQDWTLDEEVELRHVVVPVHVLERRLRLRSRGVENEDGDRPERTRDRADEPGDLALVRHVRGEGLRRSRRPRPISAATSSARSVLVQAVDGHREAVSGQPHSDVAPEPARATGDERDAPRSVTWREVSARRPCRARPTRRAPHRRRRPRRRRAANRACSARASP